MLQTLSGDSQKRIFQNFLFLPRTTQSEALQKKGPGNIFCESVHMVLKYRSRPTTDIATLKIKVPISLHKYNCESIYQNYQGVTLLEKAEKIT